MAIFDTSLQANLDLLHPDTVGCDLSKYAGKAERDVLDYYTQLNGLTWTVSLQGYDTTPADIEATLSQALIDTIADVISYRVIEGGRDSMLDGVRRERLGDHEIEYATVPSVSSSQSGFPDCWNYRLVKFDVRDLWFH